MEGPSAHVLVEILKIGILPHGFVVGLAVQPIREEAHEAGFAGADIACHDEVFPHGSPPSGRSA